MLRAILLDFDGIIVESNHIKGLAFGELFEDFPQHKQAILDYHFANGGISRYRKIEHIYKEMLKEPLSPAQLKALGQRFSELVFEKVVQCPFVTGAEEFLDQYNQAIQLFIISATPQKEIAEIVNMRGL